MLTLTRMPRHLILGLVLAPGMCVGAQTATHADRVAAIEAVIDYRAHVLQDTSRFSACALARVLELPALQGALHPQSLKVVDTEMDCSKSSAPIVVETITSSDTTGVVTLTVTHDEYMHRETYVVRHRDTRWWVAEAHFSAGSQFIPRRMPRRDTTKAPTVHRP